MKEFSYVVTDEMGIHARPAGILVKQAAGYTSKITLNAPNGSADLKRIMAVMRLAVKKGNQVTVTCDGPDEAKACEELEAFFKANL